MAHTEELSLLAEIKATRKMLEDFLDKDDDSVYKKRVIRDTNQKLTKLKEKLAAMRMKKRKGKK